MFALDTNTVSYFLQGQGRVTDRLKSVSPRDVALPAIVEYELMYGINKDKSVKRAAARRALFGNLVSTVEVLPFDGAAAKAAAAIRIDLEKKGTPIGPHDLLIAAIALANKATLITRNTREFGRIKDLHVEDWY